MLGVGVDLWFPDIAGGSLAPPIDYSKTALALDFKNNQYWSNGVRGGPAEIGVNSDFAANLNSWSSEGTPAVWQAGGFAKWDTAGPTLYFYQNGGIVAGQSYELTAVVTAVTGGNFRLCINNPAGNTYGPTITAPGTYTAIIPATFGANGNFSIQSTAAGSITLDKFSIRALGLSSLPGYAFARSGVQGATDSKGAVQWFNATNYAKFSQAFDNPAWGVVSGSPTLTPNYGAAPDGSMTADRFQAPANSAFIGNLYQQGMASTGTTQRVGSIWMRSLTGGNLEVDTDLTEPGVLNHHQQNTVTPVWQRFSNVQNFSSAASGTSFGFGVGANGLAIDILVWQAQVEPGGVAGQPAPTGAVATIVAPAINDRGFHAYGDLTNKALQSQAFDDAAWTKSAVTVTANAVAAPDGAVTADKIIPDATVGRHLAWMGTGLAGAIPLTISMFAKAAGNNFAAIGLSNGGGYWGVAQFNLATGTFVGFGNAGGVIPNPTPKIINCGNGYYRLIAVFAANVEVSAFNGIAYMATFGGDAIFEGGAGDGVNGFQAWQPQCLQLPCSDGGPLIVSGATAGVLNASDLKVTQPITADTDFIMWGIANFTGTAVGPGRLSNQLLMTLGGAGHWLGRSYADDSLKMIKDGGGITFTGPPVSEGRAVVLYRRKGQQDSFGYKLPNGTVALQIGAAPGTDAFTTTTPELFLGQYANKSSQLNGILEGAFIALGAFTDAQVSAILAAA